MSRFFRLIGLVPFGVLITAACLVSLDWSENRARFTGFGHPAQELRLGMDLLAQGTEPEEPYLKRKMVAALQVAPLEDEPFIVSAMHSFAEGRYVEARTAVQIARRRNPRSLAALYMSADVELALGDIRSAVESLETLTRIAPRQRKISQEALFLLTGSPETGSTAFAALQNNAIKSAALLALARSDAEPSRLLEAIKQTNAKEALVAKPAEITAITMPLVNASNVAGAYKVWSAMLVDPPASQALIRDPDFSGALPPPFGWNVQGSPNAYAEMRPDGLVGEAYGRRSAVVAAQLLHLPAGRYRIVLEIEVASDLVETTLRCSTGTELSRVSLTDLGDLSAEFTVPADCQGQWIELKARASDPPRTGAFHLRSVRVVKAGA